MKALSDNRYVIVMAGGRGERFWPVSREKTPKQLVTLLGDRSFLQQAVDRVLPLVPLKNILVITNAVQAPEVRRQLPKLPRQNIVAEPCGRDTCAAVTLGAALVGARDLNSVMAVLPADHVIPDEKKFQQTLGDAFDLAGRGQVIVTIGIKPTEPATGYGYIRTGVTLPPPHGVKRYKTPFFKTEQFVEKPNYERALEYLTSGQYRWNAGMFIWSFVTVTQGLEQHQPEMAAACQRWFKVAGTPKLDKTLAKDYPDLKKISIDFALMEHAQNVVVADGDFAWDDLGSWTALARHLKPDPEGNCAVADFIHVDGARNIIFDARTTGRTPIAVVGLRDAILVQTDDATLLAHKSQAQKVKELVKRLAEHPKFKRLV
ncbi:MAG: NTP transferase domain-containing protein [Verrucomicrobia bacterium]|nr:NTP transferase domain-containing protein [Verrucomicrobiota bacterium]